YILFFHSPAHPPHLHSFPTRRSSDLSWHWNSCRKGASAACSLIFLCIENLVCSCGADFGPPPQTTKSPIGFRPPQRRASGSLNRSEEHTSELQSSGHLVCRLLLEKKK